MYLLVPSYKPMPAFYLSNTLSNSICTCLYQVTNQCLPSIYQTRYPISYVIACPTNQCLPSIQQTRYPIRYVSNCLSQVTNQCLPSIQQTRYPIPYVIACPKLQTNACLPSNKHDIQSHM